MNFFEGIPLYQISLFVLGAFFFLVLVFAFVTLLLRGKPYGKLLVFFVIPIVMMGFPAIKSFQYKGLVVTLDQSTAALQKDPTNTALRDQVQDQVKQVANQPNQSPQTMLKIAASQFALGQEANAKALLQKALPTSSQLPEAVNLQKRIELNDQLKAQTAQVVQHPADATAKTDLQKTLSDASKLQIANPHLLGEIAQAHSVLGNQTEALTLADKALKIDPNLENAKQAKIRALAVRPQ